MRSEIAKRMLENMSDEIKEKADDYANYLILIGKFKNRIKVLKDDEKINKTIKLKLIKENRMMIEIINEMFNEESVKFNEEESEKLKEINNKKTLEDIKVKLITAIAKFNLNGDISDLGNEIGIVIGLYTDSKVYDIDKEDFIHGIRHGISLSDGTH